MSTDPGIDTVRAIVDASEARIMTAITDATAKIIAALAGTSRPTGGQSSAPANTAAGLCFPNYGRAKNQPVSGASRGDLDFYAGGCRRTLDDPAKSRWHDKERDLLAAIEAEIAKQSGGGGSVGGTFAPDDEIPF